MKIGLSSKGNIVPHDPNRDRPIKIFSLTASLERCPPPLLLLRFRDFRRLRDRRRAGPLGCVSIPQLGSAPLPPRSLPLHSASPAPSPPGFPPPPRSPSCRTAGMRLDPSTRERVATTKVAAAAAAELAVLYLLVSARSRTRRASGRCRGHGISSRCWICELHGSDR